MELKTIRRTVIAALFSDEVLFRHLVLKGGNALELVHGLISRGSIDIDFSISGEFDDLKDIQERIFQALRAAFGQHGVQVFDERFAVVPAVHGTDAIPWWGGYQVEFKIIETNRIRYLMDDKAAMQREAITIDGRQGRTFRIDISKHEYCRDKIRAIVEGQTIYVYSEEMCLFEKFRSLCQQLPEYLGAVGKSATPRARDFYDIYSIISKRAIDIALPENLDLCRAIFDAKHVPLRLIPEIATAHDFHEPDWDAVRQAVAGTTFDFDFYFDFVMLEAGKLKPLWVE